MPSAKRGTSRGEVVRVAAALVTASFRGVVLEEESDAGSLPEESHAALVTASLRGVASLEEDRRPALVEGRDASVSVLQGLPRVIGAKRTDERPRGIA